MHRYFNFLAFCRRFEFFVPRTSAWIAQFAELLDEQKSLVLVLEFCSVVFGEHRSRVYMAEVKEQVYVAEAMGTSAQRMKMHMEHFFSFNSVNSGLAGMATENLIQSRATSRNSSLSGSYKQFGKVFTALSEKSKELEKNSGEVMAMLDEVAGFALRVHTISKSCSNLEHRLKKASVSKAPDKEMRAMNLMIQLREKEESLQKEMSEMESYQEKQKSAVLGCLKTMRDHSSEVECVFDNCKEVLK